MSKRHFSILLLVTVVVAIAVFLMPTRTGRDAAIEAPEFMPALAGVVNELEQVRITSNGGADVITLEREEDGWVVAESHRYPADWSVLRPLLAALSQARIVEAKTANPDYYDRLGVEDPTAEGASSTLVEFPGADDLPAVIIGNSAQNREGQYLRLEGEARSVLVDRTIDIPIDRSGWLAAGIVDVPESEVLEVRITHPDGEVVHIHRNDTDVADFTLSDIPEGRKTRSAWTINQIAAVLDGLDLESVAPVDDVDWENAIEMEVRAEDGLVVRARLVEEEALRWLRLSAEGGGRANAINERVEGWAYQIALYKYDAVNKRMENLLAEVEEEETD